MVTLMVLVVGITVGLAGLLVGRAVEHRLRDQMTGLAEFIRQHPGMPMDARVLKLLAASHNVELAFTRDGRVYRDLTTLPPGAALSNPSSLTLSMPVELQDPDPVTLTLHVAVPRLVVEQERTAALRPLLLVGLMAVGLSMLLPILLARSIARPIEELARAVSGRPTSDLPVPAGAPAEVAGLTERFNRLLAEVRRAEQLSTVGRVAAMMAHEIRNPLSSMKLNVQLLESRGDKAAREHARRLLVEIDRLAQGLDVLLDAARPAPLQRQKTPLSELVRDVVTFMKPRLDHWKVGVEVAAAPAPEVMADRMRLKGVLINLLLNAAQAMPEGGRIRISIAGANGSGARVTVQDDGPGVPESVRGRLFEPFVTTRPEGMGLGLAIARSVVEEHGGRVGYEPASPGARFWLELPS